MDDTIADRPVTPVMGMVVEAKVRVCTRALKSKYHAFPPELAQCGIRSTMFGLTRQLTV